MTTRREFLKQSALVSLAPWVPAFLPRSVHGTERDNAGRILVVIQMDGGNDGLNTVIPFADDRYAELRPTLKISADKVLKVNDSLGLHPSMKGAADLLQEGRFAIVQGVGYPNPNRSHFESMSIWQHANTNLKQHDRRGWLGRMADQSARISLTPDSIFVGDTMIPIALRGRRANAASLERESDLLLQTPVTSTYLATDKNDLSLFIARTMDQSFEAARRFDSFKQKDLTGGAYPATQRANRLKLISRLIQLDGGTQVYYVSQGGYDTHAGQSPRHQFLLGTLSGAVTAFLNDLKAAGLEDRVMVMAFSEFGRPAQENGSAGTDHGAAGPVFLAGGRLQQTLIGEHPSLDDLDQGDLRAGIDFRQVYGTLLANWLKVSPTPILQGDYPLLDIVKAS